MRIGIDIRELEIGKRTGIGRYIQNLLEYAETERPEHSFYLYGNQHTDVSLKGANMLVRIVEEKMTFWWDQVVLPALAKEDGLDVFLSPYVKGPGRVGMPSYNQEVWK